MSNPVRKVVILGGGTAGWMSAALIKKLIGARVSVELVESETIGTIGVGEATIPPIKLFNSALGINEAEFIRETKASIKLAIKFENWKVEGESYFHTFGAAGKSLVFCHFHHLLNKSYSLGNKSHLWEYDLNYLCAEAGKFAQIQSQDPMMELPNAYHFDATLYAKFLRKFSEKLGVVRTEGLVQDVSHCPSTGNIKSLHLKDGIRINGDLFIDCSGIAAILIEKKLKTGYEDWGHWLHCDRAVAVPSERFDKTVPYTRSIAHKIGWQWQIPLQHRNGNGLVYPSNQLSDDEASNIILNSLGSKALKEPMLVKYRTGRRLKQWNKNVISIGLSSGFLEPLESTSIHLIQSAIVRLVHYFPHNGINESSVNDYNRKSKVEYEQIRDFIILHYHVNQRDDSQFWKDLRNMEAPESLARKIKLFSESGLLFREQDDLFLESSWLQVMLGQGITPKDYHPIADNIPDAKLLEMLKQIKNIKQAPIKDLPSHDDYLKNICKL